MSTMRIIFYVDPTQLPKGGSFGNPVGLAHALFQLKYGLDTAALSSFQSADYAVPVPSGSRVQISICDVHGRPGYVIAPVRFLAGTWCGKPCDIGMLTGPDAPLDTPQFDQQHDEAYGYNYVSGQSIWVGDTAPFTSYMPGGSANVSRDATPATPLIREPFLSFSVSDQPGDLWYGIECKVAVNGVDADGSYWFDPNIRVSAA